MSGVGTLARLILRRDRRITPVWVIYGAIIPAVFVIAMKRLFPTDAAREAYAATSAVDPAFVALYTRLYGSAVGVLTVWRLSFVPVIIGLVTLLAVIRHTRTEEQAGRRELIGATAVGRGAGLAAALVTTCAASLALGVLVAVGMIATGQPAGGSFAYGAEYLAIGWVFAGVGAVAAQLTGNAGSARGIAVVVLAASYVLRAAGDVSSLDHGPVGWLSWLSPFGWIQRVRPFDQDDLWPILLAVAVTAALVLLAVVLAGHRDLGAGLLPPRLGRASAGPLLHSSFGLAWRLHRVLLLGWTAGFAVLGIVLGDIATTIGGEIGDSTAIRTMFDRLGGVTGITDNYLSAMLGLMGMVAAGYAIQATLRARAEEAAGRIEPVLATAIGRYRWLAGHLVFSLLGPAVTLAVLGLAMGIANGLNTGDVGGQVSDLLGGAMVQLPAVWVLAAITVVLFGLAPRAAAGGWAALAICVLIGMVGSALGVARWVLDISPFTHIPHLPGGTVSATPLILLVVIAVVLGGIGLAGFRRRDVPVG